MSFGSKSWQATPSVLLLDFIRMEMANVHLMFSDNNDEILFPFKYKGLLTCFHFLYAKILLIAHALFSSLQFLQQGS